MYLIFLNAAFGQNSFVVYVIVKRKVKVSHWHPSVQEKEQCHHIVLVLVVYKDEFILFSNIQNPFPSSKTKHYFWVWC